MYFILLAYLLIAAYIATLVVEARRGERYLAAYRARLDQMTEQVLFIARHVDFGSFARIEARRATLYFSHESAHLALQAVRVVERFLTHIVKRLRLHPEAPAASGESTRHFVRTLSEFKGQLETTRPEMPEVR